jgi:hypothetical protein
MITMAISGFDLAGSVFVRVAFCTRKTMRGHFSTAHTLRLMINNTSERATIEHFFSLSSKRHQATPQPKRRQRLTADSAAAPARSPTTHTPQRRPRAHGERGRARTGGTHMTHERLMHHSCEAYSQARAATRATTSKGKSPCHNSFNRGLVQPFSLSLSLHVQASSFQRHSRCQIGTRPPPPAPSSQE